jgi:hypothetical protein
LATIVEFGGCSGFPHALGSEIKCSNYNIHAARPVFPTAMNVWLWTHETKKKNQELTDFYLNFLNRNAKKAYLSICFISKLLSSFK